MIDKSKVYTNISLVTVLLVAGAMVAQSHIASEIFHKKLEDSFSMNYKVLYQIHEAFFYLKGFLLTGFTFMYVLHLAVSILGVVRVTSHTSRSFSGAVLL